MTDDNVLYDSQRLKKLKATSRSFVGGNKGFYIFRIRAKKPEGKGWRGRHPIVLELHSSVTANAIGRTTMYPRPAATEIHMSKEEAGHLLAALLSAMNPRED